MINSNFSGLPDYNQRYIQNIRYNFQANDGAKPLSKKQKAIVLASAAIGTAPVLVFWAKKSGFSLNLSKIFKTPIKDWALFKYKPIDKVIEYEAPQILSVATGSVAGGFVGGAIVDKNNIKAKKREVLNQMLGDILVPIGSVFAGAKIFKQYEEKLVNLMPQIAKDTKWAKIINTVSKNTPNAVATIAPLAVGIIIGNKVSNFINEKLYHKKVDRNIRVTDFAPHVDDLCMSVSMVNSGSTFASALGRVIPFALLVPGYETGTARED